MFLDSVVDPAIGISGDLALRTFANAERQNWTSSIQIATFELATRIGVPMLDNQPMGRAAIAFSASALPGCGPILGGVGASVAAHLERKAEDERVPGRDGRRLIVQPTLRCWR